MENRKRYIRQMLGQKVHIEIDRPIGYLHGNIRYPINYGFIPGTIAGDGEAQDVYVLGVNQPLSSFDGEIVGGVLRMNDCEDKLVAAPEGMIFHQGQIAEAVNFQEQFFDTRYLSLFYKSCGVLPYRTTGEEKEYLIVYEQFSQCWSLPKGHMEAGETEAATALRELFEETGLTAVLDTNISATIEYPVPPSSRKQVVLFPGLISGTPKPRAGEIEDFRWIKENELSDYLFPDTVAACKKLIAGLSNDTNDKTE